MQRKRPSAGKEMMEMETWKSCKKCEMVCDSEVCICDCHIPEQVKTTLEAVRVAEQSIACGDSKGF